MNEKFSLLKDSKALHQNCSTFEISTDRGRQQNGSLVAREICDRETKLNSVAAGTDKARLRKWSEP
jgi:hypothetical protein